MYIPPSGTSWSFSSSYSARSLTHSADWSFECCCATSDVRNNDVAAIVLYFIHFAGKPCPNRIGSIVTLIHAIGRRRIIGAGRWKLFDCENVISSANMLQMINTAKTETIRKWKPCVYFKWYVRFCDRKRLVFGVIFTLYIAMLAIICEKVAYGWKQEECGCTFVN